MVLVENFPVFRSLYKPDDSIPETYLFSHRKEYVEHLQSLGYKRRVRWVFAKTVNTDFQCSIELTCYRAPEIAPFSFKSGISSLKVWNLLGRDALAWPAVGKPGKMSAHAGLQPEYARCTQAFDWPAARLLLSPPMQISTMTICWSDTDATLAYVEDY